jgi:imidazolonepropionase-like amidohydrolase
MPTMPDKVTCTISGVTGPSTSGEIETVSAAGMGPGAGAGQRAALLIRGGYVITMDPAAGDIPGGDVLVSRGMIAAVGAGLTAPAGATELDATGMIVAPGLVDTHWHRAGAEAGRRAHHAERRTGRPGRAAGAGRGYCPSGASDAVSWAGRASVW